MRHRLCFSSTPASLCLSPITNTYCEERPLGPAHDDSDSVRSTARKLLEKPSITMAHVDSLTFGYAFAMYLCMYLCICTLMYLRFSAFFLVSSVCTVCKMLSGAARKMQLCVAPLLVDACSPARTKPQESHLFREVSPVDLEERCQNGQRLATFWLLRNKCHFFLSSCATVTQKICCAWKARAAALAH